MWDRVMHNGSFGLHTPAEEKIIYRGQYICFLLYDLFDSMDSKQKNLLHLE
jgi:hypothetical protein